MTMVDTHAEPGPRVGSRPDRASGGRAEYRPPVNEDELLLKWIRRARESQKSHYDMADLLAARNRMFGIGVTVVSAVVGTTVFLSLVARMIRDASMAGHEVVFEPSGVSVMAKPLALKRAIGNLFDNALFYGQKVEIAIRQSQAVNGDMVEIEIRDHGPGVPEDAMESLFQPYLRLEHGRNLNSGGMGLGLGISRNIVQAHGGELLLRNHPQGGLIATIILPAR